MTPLSVGSHSLYVSARGEIGGVLQANDVIIRIELAGATKTLEVSGTLKTDQGGSSVISMPLEEVP